MAICSSRSRQHTRRRRACTEPPIVFFFVTLDTRMTRVTHTQPQHPKHNRSTGNRHQPRALFASHRRDTMRTLAQKSKAEMETRVCDVPGRTSPLAPRAWLCTQARPWTGRRGPRRWSSGSWGYARRENGGQALPRGVRVAKDKERRTSPLFFRESPPLFQNFTAFSLLLPFQDRFESHASPLDSLPRRTRKEPPPLLSTMVAGELLFSGMTDWKAVGRGKPAVGGVAGRSVSLIHGSIRRQ